MEKFKVVMDMNPERFEEKLSEYCSRDDVIASRVVGFVKNEQSGYSSYMALVQHTTRRGGRVLD